MKVAINSSAKNNIIEPPRVEVASLDYEKGMVLFTYALALIYTAESTLIKPSSTGSSQANQTNDKWKQITVCLVKAESIFRYLLEQDFSSNPEVSQVVDISPTVLGALISLISGSLHLTAIYKAQEQKNTSSPSFNSRVALYASEMFSSAFQMFSSVSATTVLSNSSHNALSSGTSSSSTNEKKRFHIPTSGIKQLTSESPLLSWLESVQKYCISSAEVFMAQTSYKKNEVGLAIGHLLGARTSLQSIDKKFLQQQKQYDSIGGVAHLKNSIDDLLRNYQAENDRISFQPIPTPEEVKQKWPSGREIAPKQAAWTPPQSLLTTGEDYFSSAASGNQKYEKQQGYY